MRVERSVFVYAFIGLAVMRGGPDAVPQESLAPLEEIRARFSSYEQIPRIFGVRDRVPLDTSKWSMTSSPVRCRLT